MTCAHERLIVTLAALLPVLAGTPAAAQPPVGAVRARDQPASPFAARRVTFDRGTPAAPQAAASKVFNPDISVIGNFVGVAGENTPAGEPALQLSEVEVAYQAVVDPYSRADFFVAIGPEGAEIEEGFITFTALPANLLLKVGKLRASFGKMNTLHTHRLPSADRPLVTGNLVGGEEGLSDAGFSVSHLVANPVVYLELTGEVFAGRSDVFEGARPSQLVYLGRARAYRDLTESTNLDVGVSVAQGPSGVFAGGDGEEGESPFDKRLVGIDVTLRYRPLRAAVYRRLNLRAEFIWSRIDDRDENTGTAAGFYALGEYQFARRWYVGARADRSGRAVAPDEVDRGGSVFLTFWPTEYSQIRGQYRHTRFAGRESARELLVQFNFSIGAHGAHVF